MCSNASKKPYMIFSNGLWLDLVEELGFARLHSSLECLVLISGSSMLRDQLMVCNVDEKIRLLKDLNVHVR